MFSPGGRSSPARPAALSREETVGADTAARHVWHRREDTPPPAGQVNRILKLLLPLIPSHVTLAEGGGGPCTRPHAFYALMDPWKSDRCIGQNICTFSFLPFSFPLSREICPLMSCIGSAQWAQGATGKSNNQNWTKILLMSMLFPRHSMELPWIVY